MNTGSHGTESGHDPRDPNLGQPGFGMEDFDAANDVKDLDIVIHFITEEEGFLILDGTDMLFAFCFSNDVERLI